MQRIEYNFGVGFIIWYWRRSYHIHYFNVNASLLSWDCRECRKFWCRKKWFMYICVALDGRVKLKFIHDVWVFSGWIISHVPVRRYMHFYLHKCIFSGCFESYVIIWIDRYMLIVDYKMHSKNYVTSVYTVQCTSLINDV